MAKDKEVPKIKLQFAPEQKSPTLEIANGEYDRKFNAADQPFECDAEESEMLLRTGHFVSQPAGAKRVAAQTDAIGGVSAAEAAPGKTSRSSKVS